MATLSVDRMLSSSCNGATALAPRALHARSCSSESVSASASVSVAGCRRRHRGGHGAAVAVALGAENTRRARFGKQEQVQRRGGRALSSMRPLADSSGNVVEFQTEEEFNSIIEGAGEKLVVVDISTTTCGPCKMIFPKYVEMSLEYPDAVFLKINGDVNADARALMRKWGVRAVPNFRFFKKGEQVHSHTGAKLDELKKRFAEHYEQPLKV